MTRPLSIAYALSSGAARLARVGVETPRRDAELLLADLLGFSQAQLAAASEAQIDDQNAARFDALLIRREARIPLAHILGRRAFWRHDFEVTADVLDPRPDTEALVELALAESFERVLDLGTGSGAIMLSLIAERPEATGVGTDISASALAVAERNAAALGVINRVHFVKSDWFGHVDGSYDLIVSNPPYVSELDYAALAPEVHHEPKIALTPGGDGLDSYRVIAREAPGYLTPGGRLLVEIGFDQGGAVSALFRAAGLDEVTVHPDINGKERVVSARFVG
ncbi:MAG: peptide chain release factor N(5)-glutamine methyltransferase [Pseudomonadota bacterium]